MSQPRVGLIGVGLVGLAIAERLLNADWLVTGFDLNAAQMKLMQQRGCQVAASASDVIDGCNLVLFSLPTSGIVSDVVRKYAGSLSGKTFVDTTTGEPEQMVELGAYLQRHGCQYLDVTIAGSSAQVRSGEAIGMIGGETSAVSQCEPLIRAFTRQCFHVGPCGAGARMKLVVNLIPGLNRAVLAEGLAFAQRIGVDPESALEVLKAGPAFSRVMETKADKMLSGDFTPQARLSQHLKDVRLILANGHTHAAKLPLSNLHVQLLEHLEKSGFGDLDNSAIYRAFTDQ